MKKILVVLLVLVVAGGVFAQQGEWSLEGGVGVGLEVQVGNPATVGASDYYGTKGNLDAAYNRDGLKISLGFSVSASIGDTDTADSGSIGAAIEYAGENYALKAAAPLRFMILDGAKVGANPFDVGSIDELWGYYKLLNGMIHLEAAYKGRGSAWWMSDDTAYWNKPNGSDADKEWTSGANASMLLADVTINNIEFGMLVPYLYQTAYSAIGPQKPNVNIIDDAFMDSVVGIKFVMDPIEFAAQFRFRDTGVYVGGKWFVGDALTVGLSFQGLLSGTPAYQVGGKVTYKNEDYFGASVAVKYGDTGAGAETGIEPGFWYNVLPDTLRFSVDAGFYLGSSINWKLVPELTWNFLRTGAGKGNTGMGVKYEVNSSDPKNSLYVGFKWGFF